MWRMFSDVMPSIQECGTEGIPEKCVVKMLHIFPETVVTEPTFGKQAVDMRVPFQIPAKSMQDKDKSGRIVHGFVHFVEHAQDDAVHGMEKAVQKCAVMVEKIPHVGQPYIAPPKAGSPQFIIFSIFSISQSRGWRVYFISSKCSLKIFCKIFIGLL